MADCWIYIGADKGKFKWSKIGKTAKGLEGRHRSSQNPDYFIYVAFEIVGGNVNEIELKLLNYLERKYGYERLDHWSTGRKSECFSIDPYTMKDIVESFILDNYSSSVEYDYVSEQISYFQCHPDVYEKFKWQSPAFPNMTANAQSSISESSLPQNLEMSKDKYYSGNHAQHEIYIGEGYYVDLLSGAQVYRDDDGNEEWPEYK